GFCSTLPQFSTGFPGGTLCANGGSPHNNEWLTFAAGTPNISLRIDISNCTSVPCGGGTCIGLQAGIYDDCNLSNELACEGNCSDTQITLSSSSFEVGQVYYLFLDGCAGSVCDYEITVLQGVTTAPVPGDHTTPTGTTVVCENGQGTYFIPPVPNASEYDWTLPPGASIISGDNNEIVVAFGGSGGQVCVQAFNECYPPTLPPLCMDVMMVPPAINNINDTYCTGGTYFFEGDGNTYTDFGFPYVITLPIPSYLGCDSIVNLSLTEVPLPPEPLTDFVCEGDIYIYEGDGNSYFPGFNEIVLPNASFEGCDSTVHLDLIQYFDAFNTIDVAICEGDVYQACGVNLSLTSNYTLTTDLCGNSFQGCDSTVFVNLTVLNPESVISVDPPGVIGCDGAGIVLHGLNSNFATETYEWTSPDITGDICSGNPFESVILVCSPATYCLTTTMSYTTFEGITTTCSDMVCVEITEDIIAPDINASATDVDCDGGMNGTAEVTVNNLGAGPFSYLWEPGNFTDASISDLAAGDYTVTVTGDNGCTATETVSVEAPQAIVATIDEQAIDCNGANNGSATISATGGEGTYTYLWCNGQTTATATGLPPGICSVTITDGNQCEIIEQVDITEPTVVDLTATHEDITCNGAADGTASVTASGGEGTYSYLWCNGQTTAMATGLAPGL
ncbi:MAG: hypothetical protein AAGD05_14725, partial [Bacteroidota bacterium]